MPTGYTAKLMEKGQTFEEFIMRCARAMSACIMLRDEPMDKPIPDKFKPSDFYPREIRKAREELKHLLAMSREEQEVFGSREIAKRLTEAEQSFEKTLLENGRLAEMRKQVDAWNPPTDEHAGLKTFMLQQLDISQNPTDYQREKIAKLKSEEPHRAYDEALTNARNAVSRYEESYGEELERVEGRNKWIASLRESLATSVEKPSE